MSTNFYRLWFHQQRPSSVPQLSEIQCGDYRGASNSQVARGVAWFDGAVAYYGKNRMVNTAPHLRREAVTVHIPNTSNLSVHARVPALPLLHSLRLLHSWL